MARFSVRLPPPVRLRLAGARHLALARSTRGLLLAVVSLLASVEGCKQRQTGEYPRANVFVYVFSNQGGSTDQWVRHLSSIMQREWGVHIVCNDLPGAKGGTGAMKVWNSPHDGYSVLGASETAMCFGVNGVAPTADHWEYFIAAGSPGVLAVSVDSRFNTIQDLVAAARSEPEKVSIGNSGQGKLWHIKAVQLERGAGVLFQHVPYNGSAPAITALLSKEVEAVSCSAGEIVELIRGRMARPLLVLETTGMDFAGFGHVPAAPEFYPSTAEAYRNYFQWLGFMLPSDVPPGVLQRFGTAFEKALNDPRTTDFLNMQMARKISLWGKEAKTLAMNMQSEASWMAKDLNLAVKDPAGLGIPRPQ